MSEVDRRRRAALQGLYKDALKRARADPPGWPYPLGREGARVFDLLPERFSEPDAVSAAEPAGYSAAEVRVWISEWAALGMAAPEGAGAYLKTGRRPYPMDRGMLS